jgi:C4-dicarboxylate-specific signal transduction histidine kinase
VSEAGRVASIVRNLLTFARHESEGYGVASVRELIDDTLTLVSSSLRRDEINLALDVPRDLPPVACRAQQIQQVLMNLLTNARDALTQRYPGHHDDKVIELQAGTFERDGTAWVSIAVQDHGIGVPPDIADRIFDPFFTTKPRQQGTGLGLSVSHGIIADHGGALRLDPASPMTRFVVELRANAATPG